MTLSHPVDSRAPATAARSTRLIAIANQKGGVGKTTTAINLSAAMVEGGARVLLIDLDPQGNASTGVGLFAADRERTAYDLLIGEATAADCIMKTRYEGFDVIPSSADLSGLDVELFDDPHRAQRLRDALVPEGEESALAGYDIVLIDCPPSLNILTVNAMTAAGSVLVPLQCEFFALEGLSQLLATIRRVQQRLNPSLVVEGILLTMYDRRNNLSAQVAVDVRETLGQQVYTTIIPRNVRLSEAPSHAEPVTAYDSACAGSEAYRRLAAEVAAGQPGQTPALEEASP
ncbi:MAG: AAA family ATPase [Pseudomonadota bacterium]